MKATAEQQKRIFRDGYVVVPAVVPDELRLAAIKAINVSLGQNGIDPARLVEFRTQTFCPELRDTPAITDLYHRSPLKELTESLLGPTRPVVTGQMALRFPADGPFWQPKPHIDGTHAPNNGVPEGELHSFSVLVGVFLTDVIGPGCGNFAVWPGSHHRVAEWCRAQGPQSLLRGLPAGVAEGEPVELTARAGDAVLAHHLVGHSVTGNAAPFPRYTVFFRVHHTDHETLKWESLTDPWREWPGLRFEHRV